MAKTIRMTARVYYQTTLSDEEEAAFFEGAEATPERLRELMDTGKPQAFALRDLMIDEGLDILTDEQWEIVE